MDATTGLLEVPGASLHYEVRGSGPVLMLVGAPMDSSGFAPIVPVLARDHTVVTYDPRGLARSTREDSDQDVTPDVMADDLHELLVTVGSGPTAVLGSSGGAVTSLAWVTRHPQDVQTLVAHEPPLTVLLPDSDQLRAGVEGLRETHRTQGLFAALQAFLKFASLDEGPAGQAPPDPEARASIQAGMDQFFEHMLGPISLYQPDLAALRRAPTRIVAGGGAASRGQLAQRGAAALADQLGITFVEFPGDHVGFAAEPEAFARVLRQTLGDTT